MPTKKKVPNLDVRLVQARQRAIGRRLRVMWEDVVQEPVPDEMLDLLRQLDESDHGKKDA